MPRVKRGVIANKRRKNILSKTKGYRFGRKSKERIAQEAIRHAGAHSFRDRRAKNRNFRGLWQTKINAVATEAGLSYSKFIGALKKKGIIIDRKILAELAEKEPKLFAKILEAIK